MDTIFTRLEEASLMGDVESLKRLLEEDKLLLDRATVRTTVGDSPLHVASLLGHADFVREIINQKPKLAKELNGQGLSPLHLAAANGHLAVVKELLKASLYIELCYVREKKEGLMPLHVAVIKGRTDIVKELVVACEATMRDRIHGGETVLHLAVKSNSLETLEFLISHVDDLNAKDDKGNTMLHLAVARKQSSVIELLLSKPASLDVNITNSKGSTPLDVLLESQHEYGDLVIGEMIRAAGGTTATRPRTSQHVLPDHVPIHGSDKLLSSPSAIAEDAEIANPQSDESTNALNKQNPDMLMVVAILVATITFQAALNPPTPFQPPSPRPNTNTNSSLSPDPNDDYQDEWRSYFESFVASQFLIFDMIGLFLSVSVILLFLCVVPRKGSIMLKCLVWILWIATFSMAFAFTIAIQEIFGSIDRYKAISALLRGWLVVMTIGIFWAAIRITIFLLDKGKMLQPIKKIFSMKKLFKWRRLNGATKTTNSYSSCLKKTASIVSILSLFIGIGYIYAILFLYFMGMGH